MPLDVSDPRVIAFLSECYNKTLARRSKWISLNSEKLKQAATFHNKEKGYREEDVLKKIIEFGMPAITRDNIISSSNKRCKSVTDTDLITGTKIMKKEYTIPKVGLGDPKDDPRLDRPDTDLTLDPIMRPVCSEEKIIIYENLPLGGRLPYLCKRNTIKPESKYYFKECSSWEYGWRLRDSKLCNVNAPTYGRVFTMKKEHSRTGSQPDPAHYTYPEREEKCSV